MSSVRGKKTSNKSNGSNSEESTVTIIKNFDEILSLVKKIGKENTVVFRNASFTKEEVGQIIKDFKKRLSELSRLKPRKDKKRNTVGFYELPDDVRDFFKTANLGTFKNENIINWLSPILSSESSLPVTRGMVVSLINRYVTANNMNSLATVNKGKQPKDMDGMKLGATGDFKKTFKKYFDKIEDKTTGSKIDIDNFDRTHLVSLAAKIIAGKKSDLVISPDFVKGKGNVDKTSEKFFNKINEELDEMNKNMKFKYEERSHLSPDRYIQIAKDIDRNNDNLLVVATIIGVQAALSTIKYEENLAIRNEIKSKNKKK